MFLNGCFLLHAKLLVKNTKGRHQSKLILAVQILEILKSEVVQKKK